MKKKYSFFLLVLLVAFLRADSQINMNHALGLPSGNYSSDYFFDSSSHEMWMSFIADKDRMTFSIRHCTAYPKSQNIQIDSLVLYASNGTNITASAKSPNENTDTLPAIQILNLVLGNRYYLKLTKFDNNSTGYFNLSKVLLHSSILSSHCSSIHCSLGANLVCNGDFEITPSWDSTTYYFDWSDTWPNNPPIPAAVGYCISSPDMRYDYGKWGNFDYTDIYSISTYMYPFYNNTAEHGIYFMGIDCPSASCSTCSSMAPKYFATAWEENVLVTKGLNYEFSCWIEDLDNLSQSGLPGATVYIVINADTLFSDVISYGNGYGNWNQVAFCWPSNSTSANIQVVGQGTLDPNGYDFALDNISFATENITDTNNIVNVLCAGGNTGSANVNVTCGASPYTYSWSPGGGTNATETGLSAGKYVVNITDSTGRTINDTIIITEPSALSISADSLNDNGGCNGSAWVNVNGGTSPYTYYWTTGGQTTDTIKNQCNGSYCCVVTDANGCKDSVCATINLSTETSNIISKNALITIYPNLNNGCFMISMNTISDNSKIEIYNVLGQLIYQNKIVSNSTKINLTQPQGMYFYRVINNTGELMGNGKIIIEK